MKTRLVPAPVPLRFEDKVTRAVGWTVAAVVVALLVRAFSFLLAPIGLAFVAFYTLNPIVAFLENRHVGRRSAVVLCFAALLSLMLLMVVLIWPSLDQWLQETPAAAGERSVFEIQLDQRLEVWRQAGMRRFPGVDWDTLMGRVRGGLETYRVRWMETLPALAMDALSSAGIYLLAPVIALFLLLEGSAMHRKVVSLVPNRHFETVLVLLHRVDRQIAGYLRGAATQALIISFLTAFALWVVGMPNAMLLGFIFGVINVVPIVGPLIGASVGLLYSLIDPTAPSLPVLFLVYMGVHVIDLALVTPWVVGKTLDLHPLTIIVGLTVGGHLGGILGMLLSIPLIAVGKAVVGTLYEAYRQERLRV